MSISVAVNGKVHQDLADHLLRADGQEDLCFAIWYPSQGAARLTAILGEIVAPLAGERHVHGNASFEAEYFLRAAAEASSKGGGVALLHSHPNGLGWHGLSDDDVDAERTHAAQAHVLTGYPLVGLTLAGDHTWSARFWPRSGQEVYEPRHCDAVRVIADRMTVSFNPARMPVPAQTPAHLRTVHAWGAKAHSDLVHLHFGIVGLGSVGMIVAQTLARMGVQRTTLIDFDTVEEHNLDRLLHASYRDIGMLKVAIAANAMRYAATATAPEILEVPFSVTEAQGLVAALDCDVVFCCVDRPWPRQVLNFAAYAHLVPVIDGGILVETSPSGLRGAHITAQVAAPGRRCLECLGQFDPALVQVEREGRLDDPRYIQGLPEDHPVRRNENVFPFSLSCASYELAQMVRLAIAPAGVADIGTDDYQWLLGSLEHVTLDCNSTCLYSGQLVGKGDTSGLVVTGAHPVAEQARSRATRPPNLFKAALSVMGRLLAGLRRARHVI